jgi:hypothetical protein
MGHRSCAARASERERGPATNTLRQKRERGYRLFASTSWRAQVKAACTTVPAMAGLVGALILQTRTDERRAAMDNASRHHDDVATTSAERQHRSTG